MTSLLDDFTDTDAVARRWRVFSDRVMGGVSNARAEVMMVAGGRVSPGDPTAVNSSRLSMGVRRRR